MTTHTHPLGPDRSHHALPTFVLVRDEDESGVSGTGVVAQGVEFSDGTCVLHWMTDYRSTAVYRNLEELEAIHGHGGKTRIVWLGVDR